MKRRDLYSWNKFSSPPLPYATCPLLAGPLPQTAALVTHQDQLFEACYRNALPAFEEPFPSATESSGTSGS